MTTTAIACAAVTVRIGVLGAGFIARYHLAMLASARTPHEVVGIHDPDDAKAQALGRELDLPVLPSEEAVLDAADAVYVCTWTSEHPRLVAAAAAAGRAVFCEKPLAVDLAAARSMLADVRAAGVVHQVGLVLRDAPAMRLLRSLVHEPTSGPVMGVVFRDDQYLPVQGVYASDWRADKARAGAGTLLEHSIHDLDLLEWVIGPITSVTCRTEHQHAIDGIEDMAVVLATFDGGGVATLTSVWHDILARPSLRRIEVLCRDAMITAESDLWGPVRRQRDAGDLDLADDALRDELAARGLRLRNPDDGFLRAVRDGTVAAPGFEVAVRAHELLDACYRSAHAGGVPIDVPPAPDEEEP